MLCDREVDVGGTLSEREWIGMCRREIFDDFLRKRAAKCGAKVGTGGGGGGMGRGHGAAK